MRCNEVRDELALFSDGALDPGTQAHAAIAAHVAGCAACAAELAEIRALLGRVAAARPEPALDERAWQELARDIGRAVDGLPARPAWWRRPVAWLGAGAFAAAAAATVAIVALRHAPVQPLPLATPGFYEELLDEELALGNPAAVEEELDDLDLDDAAAARLEAEL